MSTENKNTNTVEVNMTKIDAALNAAKARKGKRAAGAENTDAATPEAPKAKRARLTDAERASRLASKEADRASRKAARQAARDERRAQKAASKPAAHLAKVAKAFARLPSLNDTAQETFDSITTNFSREQVNAIAQHLIHFNRVQATRRALEQRVEAGARVRVTGGDSRYVGQEGTVSKAQRIRCYVELANAKKPVYLFTSDVEVIEAAEATGTNG